MGKKSLKASKKSNALLSDLPYSVAFNSQKHATVLALAKYMSFLL
jgi:hypothetical protein